MIILYINRVYYLEEESGRTRPKCKDDFALEGIHWENTTIDYAALHLINVRKAPLITGLHGGWESEGQILHLYTYMG